MPTKSVPRKFFLFYKETPNAGVVNPDRAGYFSCRMNVARFLDIDKIPTIIVERMSKASTKVKDLTIVDSTTNTLTVSDANSDKKNEPAPYTLKRTIGTKSIRLKTGIINANKNRKTIGFVFPSWATVRNIADALGTVIPTGKMSEEPSATEIFPSFSLKGGGSYPIYSSAVALADNDTLVATDDSTAGEIANKAGVKVKKAAG